MNTSLRDRARGTSEKAVREAEARRATEQAEDFKAKAAERAMQKWFDTYGANKPMKVFEATVCSEDEVGEELGEVRTRGDGTEYKTPDRMVFYLKDVVMIEGTELSDRISFNMPEGDKPWSQHSEGAITVRESAKDAQGQPSLKELFDLCGRRWRFEGSAVATFLGQPNSTGNRFWNTQYFYRVTPLDGATPVSTPVSKLPDVDNYRQFIALMVQGNPEIGLDAGKRSTWTAAKMLKTLQASGIEDSALETMITSSTIDAILNTAESLDICTVEDGVVALT